MATTCFFDKVITDKGKKDARMEMEFGRTSHYGGESLIYFTIDGNSICVDEKIGKEIYDAMKSLAIYLGYEKMK